MVRHKKYGRRKEYKLNTIFYVGLNIKHKKYIKDLNFYVSIKYINSNMVIYTCPACTKTFNRKSNYEYHINNKKKPCIQISPTSPTSPDFSDIKEDFGEISLVDEETEIILSDNQTNLNLDKKKFSCPNCESVFKSKFNLERHKDGRCKLNKIIKKEHRGKTSNLVNIDELDIDENTKAILTVLLTQNKKLIDEMDRIKEENKEIKEENKEMKEKINKIDTKKAPKTINNTNNTNTNNTNNTNSNNMNNSNNTNNTQNNTINNTRIVAHGKEELDKIDLETIMKCLSTIKYKEIIPNMTKHVYINDKKPENKNFCVVDIARNKCKYHDGRKWLIGKTTEKINKIFDNLHMLLTDPFEKENINKTIEFIKANPKKFNEKWIKLSNIYLQSLYDEEDKESIDNKLKILEELKLMFFNNKNEILQVK